MADMITVTYRGGTRDGQTCETDMATPDYQSTYLREDRATGEEWLLQAEAPTGQLAYFFRLRNPAHLRYRT